MVAAMATIASRALPPSARTARPASTAARWGAATTPRRCPAVWRSIGTLARRLDEAALAHQRIRGRQPAAEGLVECFGVARAARREDRVVEPRRGRRVEGVARLLEGLEGVGVEHFGPHIAVTAGRITAASKHMQEMRRA